MQWWWLSWMVKKIDKLLFSELKKRSVIANQSSDWCGNPLTILGAIFCISVLARGFPRQCSHWLGMTENL